MKFDEIHLCGLKFSTTVNDNDNIINIPKYQYIMAVYLVTFSVEMGQIPRSSECILVKGVTVSSQPDFGGRVSTESLGDFFPSRV